MSKSKSLAIVCFLFSGKRHTYTIEHVDRLRRMCERYAEPHTFYLISDRHYPEFIGRQISIAGCSTLEKEPVQAWPCLNIFNPEVQRQIEEPRILKLDLDCAIVRRIDPMLENFMPDRMVGWLDPTHQWLNPSFAYFANGFGHCYWYQYLAGQDEINEYIRSGRSLEKGSDMAFINSVEIRKKFLTRESGVFHFRELETGIPTKGKLPLHCKIVFFNGPWKPWSEKMRRKHPWLSKV